MTMVAPARRHVLATVCFVCRTDRVLLQLRPADRAWGGRWNGPGGKVEPGETPADAIVREVEEETGFHVREPTSQGTLDLVFGRPAQARMTVHVFRTEQFAGRARGTAGPLRWFRRGRLPWDRMWPDQAYWLGCVLDGGHVAGSCTFDAAGDRLLSWALHLDGQQGTEPR